MFSGLSLLFLTVQALVTGKANFGFIFFEERLELPRAVFRVFDDFRVVAEESRRRVAMILCKNLPEMLLCLKSHQLGLKT